MLNKAQDCPQINYISWIIYANFISKDQEKCFSGHLRGHYEMKNDLILQGRLIGEEKPAWFIK